MKVIQMIPTSGENSIFICGFDEETSELTFRSSLNPQNKQKEVVSIDKEKGMVYTNLFFFHVNYLIKFLQENEREE